MAPKTEAVKQNTPIAAKSPASTTSAPQNENQKIKNSIFALSQKIDDKQDEKNTYAMVAISCLLLGVGLRNLYPLLKNPQLIKNPILSKIFSNGFFKNTSIIAGETATIGGIFSSLRFMDTYIEQNRQIKQLTNLQNKLNNSRKLDTKS